MEKMRKGALSVGWGSWSLYIPGPRCPKPGRLAIAHIQVPMLTDDRNRSYYCTTHRSTCLRCYSEPRGYSQSATKA